MKVNKEHLYHTHKNECLDFPSCHLDHRTQRALRIIDATTVNKTRQSRVST